MKLPATRFRELPVPLISPPLPLLRELGLLLRVAVPPIVLAVAALSIFTPSPVLPRLTVPWTSVPMKLPATRLLLLLIATPPTVLPEIRLPAPLLVPPIVLALELFRRNTPSLLLPS